MFADLLSLFLALRSGLCHGPMNQILSDDSCSPDLHEGASWLSPCSRCPPLIGLRWYHSAWLWPQMNSCRNPCIASISLPPPTSPTSLPDVFSSLFLLPFLSPPAVHAQLWSWLQASCGLVQEWREWGNAARVQVSKTGPAYLQGAL